MPSDGIRTLNENCWHYCSRCERKADLDSELQWQNGKLLCYDCFDQFPVIVGLIERRQAEELLNIIVNPDLRPNEKLVNPITQEVVDDILL